MPVHWDCVVCYISANVRLCDVVLLHTVAIHVIIAGVAFAIAVCVPLVRVLHHAAVVAGVAVAVLVAVLLVHVWLQPAVVLVYVHRHTHTDKHTNTEQRSERQ